MREYTYFFLLFMIVSGFLYAGGDKQSNPTASAQTNGAPTRTYLDINKICTPFYNDGRSDIYYDKIGYPGFEYPSGSKKTAVYESGLIWGGYVGGDPQVRVGGSAFGTGLQGGRITNSGLAWNSLTYDSSAAENVRIYRVRSDIYPGSPSVDLSKEAIWEGTTPAELIVQYLKDYNEWPYNEGAPYYTDDKGNKIPGIKGAGQTIWFVANDLNQKLTTALYGAQPMGVEYQATYWAYNNSGPLGNVIFRKYKLINKSSTSFFKMYVAMFSDIDVGDFRDDFAGCDTLLSLGYAYNSKVTDSVYSSIPPPAVGFGFIQGPKALGAGGKDLNRNGIDDAQDYATFDGRKVGPGYINLPMTAFNYFANGDEFVTDPTIGAIAGSTQFYNFFQGKSGKSGTSFSDPTTGKNTTYMLSGDPQKNSGWIDGQDLSEGDRRIALVSGPFTLAYGDTQEVVVGEIAAGAAPGVDYLSAVGLLKYYDSEAQKAYDNNFEASSDSSQAPPVPVVNVYALDKEILLKWNLLPADEIGTESFDRLEYKFQGYNVYQLPSKTAGITEAKLLASFDLYDGIKNVSGKFYDSTSHSYVMSSQSFGSDLGVQRFYDVRSDAISGGLPLTNSTEYCFGVTAYSYSTSTGAAIESAMNIISAMPAAGGTVMDSPVAPSAPVVSVTEMNKEIILNWDNTASAITATESLDKNGYKFQGYNVYQLPSASAPASDGVLLGSFDIIDGAVNITTQYFSVANNTYFSVPFKFGNDNSVQRFIDIKTDALTNSPLENGKTYYFGLTAFSYNPKAFVIRGKESSLKIITATPKIISGDSSTTLQTGEIMTNVSHQTGTGGASCYYVISDPTKLKGENYTLGFYKQSDLYTCSGSNATSSAFTEVSLVPNEAGTEVAYSVSVTDIDALGAVYGVGFGIDPYTIYKNLSLKISTVSSHEVGTASGKWSKSDTLESFSTDMKSLLIKGQLAFVINADRQLALPVSAPSYPWYLDRGTTRILSFQHNYSLDNSYITVDGIQPKIGNLTFSSPISYSSWSLEHQADPSEKNPVGIWGDGHSIFGYATGWNKDFYGGGQSVTPKDYSQDIELRFTGIADSNEAVCKSGGSWATMRSRSSSTALALVRIPFEVWEVERNRQITCVIVDRNVDGRSPWGDSGIPQWYRIAGRDYILFVAAPYDSTTVRLRTDEYTTWTLMLKDGEDGDPLCKWHTGDVLRINYNNPIIPGEDTYTFKTPNSILAANNETGKVYTFALGQNYPNPFNPATKITYSIPKAGHVSMRVFDILGREVLTLVNTEMPAGEYSVDFNASNFASGVYFYKLKAGDKSIVKKMLLLK